MYEIFESLLKEKGIRAADVAKATGIATSTFTDWKHGRYVPKYDKLQKIADYLGVSVRYLSTGDDSDEEYYLDPEVADLVDELKGNTGMRVLLDASRDLSKEDIFELLDIINKMKRGE